jgi:hypothetical protein
VSKILDVNELCDAAHDVPGSEDLINDIEAAVQRLADAVAKHYMIEAGPAEHQGSALAGLCVPFWPSFDGQHCPACIDDGDPNGEWEVRAVPVAAGN